MKALHMVSFIILIIGGLNWLLFAFGWNLISVIFGAGTTLAMIVYIIVGLAAIEEVVMHKQNCRACSTDGAMGQK
jgi:uncharacterized membrane protein YuzA (DUF378 family)